MTKTADLTRELVRPDTGLQQPQEATNWLAFIVSSSTDAIIRKTCDGVVTSFNPAAERLFGYRAEEIIGKPVRILIPADRQEEEDRILARIAAGHLVEHYETIRLYKNGSPIEVSISVCPIRDASGRIIGAATIARDITERRRAGAELERMRIMLAEGQRIAHLGSFEYIAATQETVWSDEEKRIYGLDPAGPSPAYEDMLRHHIHPEDAAELDRGFREAFQSAAVFENENRIVRPDGTIRWIYNRAHPYFDSSGQLVKYIGATLDITERKRAEAERQKFVSLADHSTEFIGMCDLDFKPFYVNEAGQRLVGLDSLEQACAARVQDYFFPEDQPMITNEFFPRVLRNGSGEVEVRFRHFKTGAALWMIYNVFAVKDEGGRIAGYATVSRDITERQAAAEALARANESLERRVEARTLELAIAKAKADEANISKTRFLAAASHDLLQPLNAARLYASSLLERSPPAELGRLARNIDASLDGVEEILNALLDISRLDSGAMKAEFSVFPVKDLLEQIRIDFEPIAKARGISFTIVASSALIRSDRKLLRRILQNLISNALKYNKEKGRAVLGCRRRGHQLVIEVHDSGLGIPDDQRDVIFKEFKRLEHHSRAPGLGLGLFIVERMCRVLDHRLSLRSRLGAGSSFSVSVPLARWPEMEPLPQRPLSYGDLRGAIVLCVDNERTIIDGMKTLLSSWQCPVIAAMDSEEAIEQLKAARITPDIIISDYHLDREDGCEAMRAIAAMCNADIPGIIATADGSNEVRAKVVAEGYAFLQKPIKPAALRALISSLIVQRQAAE